jgi:hypothetical protein
VIFTSSISLCFSDTPHYMGDVIQCYGDDR